MNLQKSAVSIRDRGGTFIEVLVSVVLLGTAGIAVLAALGATAAGAATHRNVSDAQSILATAGDAVSDTRSPYEDCESTSAADIAAAYGAIADDVRPAGSPAIEVTHVKFFDGAVFGDSCHYSDAVAGGRLQQVTLETSVDGVSRTLSVVKRPATAPEDHLGPLPPGSAGGGPTTPKQPTPGLNGP